MQKRTLHIYLLFLLLIVISSCDVSQEREPPVISNITVTPESLDTDVIIDVKFVVDVSESPSLKRIDVVQLDLTNLGGSNEQALVDDGTNGDDAADDGLYTFVFVGYHTPSTKQVLTIEVLVKDTGSGEVTDMIEIQVIDHPDIVSFDVSSNPARPGDKIILTAEVTQGEFPISAVEVDLSNIGGSANEPMLLLGSTWRSAYVIPDSGNPPLPAGNYDITLIVSDDHNPPFQSTKTIDLSLSAVKPFVGSMAPEQTIATGDTLFEVVIKSPSGHANFTKILGDFSVIGGAATQQLFDDGTNGDLAADDGIYSFTFPGASWDPTLAAQNTAYVEINISMEQTTGFTLYSWAPLFIYSGNIIRVDNQHGNDTTGDGSDVNPFKTIQKGIDEANDGDLVLVNAGFYEGNGNRDLYYNGKKIIVKSNDGADKTTIEAGGIIDPNHRIANFTKNETRESMLAGFTLTGGYITSLSHGGVFDVLDSCPGIISCVIQNSSAKERGGIMNVRMAILNFTTDPWLHRCYCENIRAGRNGGAVYAYDQTSVTLTNSVFKNITLKSVSSENVNGGVVYCYESSVYIENCVFENNELENNKSTYSARGGAIYIKTDTSKPDYTTKVINSIFINNVAKSAGGNAEGGAIYLYSSSTKIEIRSCTFVGNQAIAGGTDEARGGAICSSNSQSNMFDSILWGNTVSGSAAIGNEIEHYSSSSYNNIFNMVNCCVRNQTNDIVEIVTGTIVQTNVIHDDPKFVTGPNGDYYLEQTASGGSVNSPCVNTGSDSAVNLKLSMKTTRTDEKADEGIVDMGFHYES